MAKYKKGDRVEVGNFRTLGIVTEVVGTYKVMLDWCGDAHEKGLDGRVLATNYRGDVNGITCSEEDLKLFIDEHDKAFAAKGGNAMSAKAGAR
jgi:hypothetical protein